MKKTSITNAWFPYWQRKPQAHIRLFCFPYAGRGASIYRTWSENLPSEIEVCPVQLPGREYRILEEPFSDITPLIPLLARALHPYLDMPYALFGHSMGALVSFELARYLNQSEHAPDPMHLFVSGQRAPHLTASEPSIGQLPELAFIEELRRLNGTPEEVLQNDELLHLLMPLLRADFTLCEKYIYREESILKYPLSAFAGLQDEEVSSNELIAWREQTSGPFKYRFFIGNHFFLHEEQTSLLQAITRDLFSVLSW